MSVLMTEDKKELIATCHCGCDEGIRVAVYQEDFDKDSYAFVTYLKGHFYSEQDRTLLKVLFWKLKKIWKILIGKDFYYSEIIMNKDEYEEFKRYINQF